MAHEWSTLLDICPQGVVVVVVVGLILSSDAKPDTPDPVTDLEMVCFEAMDTESH